MKAIIFFTKLLVFLAVATGLKAQSGNTSNKGIAATLAGSCQTYACFVSDGRKNWSNEKKLAAIGELKIAHEWLQNQAGKYNVDINLTGGVIGLDKDIVVSDLDTKMRSWLNLNDCINTVFKSLGYTNAVAFVDSVKRKTEADNIHFLIFINKEDRSHALPYSGVQDNAIEGAVIYRNKNNGADVNAATVAHEILHLYGAWDLYDEKGSHTAEANEMIKKYMPYSIMLSTHKAINVYEIDEATAYLIGWHNNKKSWYEMLRPIKKIKF